VQQRHIVTAAYLVIAVCTANSLCAQSISVGGRLGLVGGTVWFEDEEANDMQQPKPGLQIGGVVSVGSHSVFSAQSELWYIQKGWADSESGGGLRLSYVELPVLLSVTAPWTTAPQLVVGISGSLELGCSVRVASDETVSCDDARVAWHRSKTQFGTWLGFGVRRWFGASRLDVQLLGNLNLTNVNRESLPRGYARLLSATLSATYVVPLGRSTR
jgi:hypothetical protein